MTTQSPPRTPPRTPPQAPPSFTYSPDSLKSRVEQLTTRDKELVDNVVLNVSVERADFSNVLLPLAHGSHTTSLELYIIGFLRSVSADSEVRAASALAAKELSDYLIDKSMRKDVFTLVEAVYHKQKDDPTLDNESRYLLEKEHLAYRRAGLDLPTSDQDRFKDIQKRLPELYIAFSRNLSEDQGGIWFAPEELNGLPNDILDTLAKGELGGPNEGKLRLTFQNTDRSPALKYCKVAETRKQVFLGNENRAKQNIDLLKEALLLRDEAARMLGYADHATFILEDRMARTPTAVNDFLNDLRKRLAKAAQSELQTLKELKRVETGSSADEYYIWDNSYYDTLLLSRNFQLDHNKIAEYFPLETCVQSMLDMFNELFGLVFVRFGGQDHNNNDSLHAEKGDNITWHPDVQLFSVWDEPSKQHDSSFLGYLYLDLHPREGKFGGAANFPLQPGFVTKDGRHYPVTALVCNFSKPTAAKPSLLKHSEVTTLFHELGHGIHYLVSQTTYVRFHGTNTARDFVEAPSKMLENWCWTPSQIKALSKHWSYLSPEYKKAYTESAINANTSLMQPEEKMPEAMIQSIIQSRYVNEAFSTLRLLHFSIFDMTIHQPRSREELLNLDVSKLYNKLRHDLCMMDDLGDAEDWHWANGAATFSHIMAGYDVGVYGYLWSEVYSADMFDTAFSGDPMNKEAGRRYRDNVLKYGGSREPMELLREFLGREPSTEAFYRQLGIA